MPRYCLECDEELAKQLEALASTYGLTESEVLEQLVVLGLEEIEHFEAPRYGRDRNL